MLENGENVHSFLERAYPPSSQIRLQALYGLILAVPYQLFCIAGVLRVCVCSS